MKFPEWSSTNNDSAPEKIKKKKERVYGDIEGEDHIDFEVRKSINNSYEKTEERLNEYYEGKINGRDLADQLGRIELGVKGEHLSAQIYAFECLLKSLSEAQGEEDAKEIVNELMFCAGIGMYDALDEDVDNRGRNFEAEKRESLVKGEPEAERELLQEEEERHGEKFLKAEYLLGLLHYYCSKKEIEKLEKKIVDDPGIEEKDASIGDRIKIFNNFHKVLRDGENSTLAEMRETIPEIGEMVELIKNDFPRDNPAGETARLIGKYYEMAGQGSTKFPKFLDLLEVKGDDDQEKKETVLLFPGKTVRVPLEKHTSREKIMESEEHQIPIGVELVINFDSREKINEPNRIRFEGDDHPEATNYIKNKRTLMGLAASADGEGNRVSKLRKIKEETDALKAALWQKLSERDKKYLGGDIDEVMVQSRTIRDLPLIEDYPQE